MLSLLLTGIITLVLALPLLVGLFFLLSYFLMLVWGAIMPELFGLPPLTYWQSCGVNFIACILFSWTGIADRSGRK